MSASNIPTLAVSSSMKGSVPSAIDFTVRSPTKLSKSELESEEQFIEEQISAVQDELDNIHNIEADLDECKSDDAYAGRFYDDALAAEQLLDARMSGLLKEGKEVEEALEAIDS